MQRRLVLGVGSGLLAALLFGLVNAVGRSALAEIEPIALVGVGYILAGIALSPFLRFSAFTARDGALLGGVVAVGGLAAPLLFFTGLAQTTAVDASLLVTTEIVFTTALAYVFLRERLSAVEGLGAALVMVGALVVSATGADGGERSLLGNALVLLAAAAWSVDNTLSTRLSERHDARTLVAVKALGGGTLVLGVAAVTGTSLSLPQSAWVAVGFIGLLGIGLSNVLFYVALRHVGASRTSVLFSTTAFFGAAAGVLFLGEPFGWPHAAAVLLLASGLAFLVRGRPVGADGPSAPT